MATLYETDFARWAAEQAGLLRAGLVNSIDYENLAEEMESWEAPNCPNWKTRPDRSQSCTC